MLDYISNVNDVDRDNIIQIYDLHRTCMACPSQWEGRVNDAGSIYIRYRWGRLTARLSMTDAAAVAAGSCVYDDDIGSRTDDRLGGYMETSEMAGTNQLASWYA